MKRNFTKKVSRLLIILTLVVFLAGSINSMAVAAATPSYPASDYFQDITAANLATPLDFNTGGVRFLLTSQGDSVGIWWSGALGLATFAISNWQKQTGKSWPYNWRSKESVAREIQVHCLVFDTTRRVTTISFSGW